MEIVRYVFYAVMTSILNIVLYLVCYDYFFHNVLISNVIAYILSTALSFWFNKTRVYQKNDGNIFYQICMYLVVKFSAFMIDSGVLYFCLGSLNLDNSLSKIISNCSTTISNYLLNKVLVFRK